MSSGALSGPAQAAGAAMAKALVPGTPQGFCRRQSLGVALKLAPAPSRAELEAVVAATPAESSRYLSTRVRQGQRAAIQQILDSREYALAFGLDTVPYLRGLQTADGIPLTTVNRTAQLYGGNAGLNPAIKGAI